MTRSPGKAHTEQGGALRYLPAILVMLALALLLPRLLTFAQVTTTFLAWPWQFDYTEGVNLSATVQLALGRNIYGHNGPESFVSAPYTPLFYILTAPVSWLTGPSLWFGRALSLAATLVIACLLAYAVRRATRNWLGGILAGALWLSLSPVIVWAALYTQHILALMFGLAGLVWAMRYPEGRRVYVAAGLMSLAFFTKQSAFDAAGAVVVWLLLLDWRRGLRFGLALALAVGLPFLGANLLLKGGLWEHAFGNQALPWNARRFGRLLDRLWGEYWPLFGLGIAGVIGTVAARLPASRKWLPQASREWGLTVLYFVFALASVLARLGRDGANYNHMIDVLLPACLLAGLAAGYLVERTVDGGRWTVEGAAGEGERDNTKGRVGSAMALVGLSGLLVVQAFLLADPRTWYLGGWPSAELDRQMRSLSKVVRETPGDIYSEDAYLALSNGRRVYYDDAFMFVGLANQGRWDESVFVRSLRDRRFSLVLLQTDSTRFTPAARKAFEENYDLKFSDLISTYAPKATPVEPQYALACTLAEGDDEVALKGYSLPPGVGWHGIAPGEVLRVTLYWQAARPPSNNYATYVHMLNEHNEVVAAVDNPQTGASKPTTEWEAGKLITDTVSLPLKPDVPAGRYKLIAGMYGVNGGAIEALSPACDGGELFGDGVSLGFVEVR
jgi:hypothetical protein